MDTKLQALRAPRTQEGPRLRQNVQTAQSPPAQRSPRRGILSAFPGRSYHRSFFFILTLLPGFVYSL